MTVSNDVRTISCTPDVTTEMSIPFSDSFKSLYCMSDDATHNVVVCKL